MRSLAQTVGTHWRDRGANVFQKCLLKISILLFRFLCEMQPETFSAVSRYQSSPSYLWEKLYLFNFRATPASHDGFESCRACGICSPEMCDRTTMWPRSTNGYYQFIRENDIIARFNVSSVPSKANFWCQSLSSPWWDVRAIFAICLLNIDLPVANLGA